MAIGFHDDISEGTRIYWFAGHIVRGFPLQVQHLYSLISTVV